MAEVIMTPHGPRDERGRRMVEKVCPVCEEPFYSAVTKLQECCSKKCARTGERNQSYKHGDRIDANGNAAWKAAKAARCEHPLCVVRRGLLVQHHVVYAQHVVRAGGDKWDPRNSMTLCNGCHVAHHQLRVVIALTMLKDRHFEFAVELLGAGAAFNYLERRYEGVDARLEALCRLPL